jgi:Beta/Gamma crystallin
MRWITRALIAAAALVGVSAPAGAAMKNGSASMQISDPALAMEFSSAAKRGPVFRPPPRVNRPAPVRINRPAPRPQQPRVIRQAPHPHKPPVVRNIPRTPSAPRGTPKTTPHMPKNPPVQSQKLPGRSQKPPISSQQLPHTRPTLPARTIPGGRDGGIAGPNNAPRIPNRKDGGFAGPKLPPRTGPSLPPSKIGKLAPPIFIGKIKGRNYSLIRGPRFIFRNGILRRLALMAAIPPLLYAGEEYAPYGYVALPRPVCEGITDDGCRLSWESVPVDGGPDEVQCVQFCPRNYVPRPVAAVAEPLPAVQAGPGCELVVYPETNFAEPSWAVNADQPDLGDWDKRISSVRVVSGTWDFFTEKNFGGETIRISKGEQADLGPDWKDQISSLMCTQQ